jgi:hypothetical protein
MLRTSHREDDSGFGWEDSFIPWKFSKGARSELSGMISELRIGRLKALIIFEAVENTGSYTREYLGKSGIKYYRGSHHPKSEFPSDIPSSFIER